MSNDIDRNPWQASSTADTQPVPVASRQPVRKRSRAAAFKGGVLLGLVLAAYLFFPGRINVLVLGIDRTPEGSAAGRSDTIILTTARPLTGYYGMLSIPRDLWVTIPIAGENRINTAHFFAEAAVEDSGPASSVETIALNFGVTVDYFIRIQFNSFRAVVDALGGVPIELEHSAGKWSAGAYQLDGEQALAFVRDRSGGDDFNRMMNGQLFIKSFLAQMMRPVNWPRLPLALGTLIAGIDSNLPIWEWPRYVFTLLRAGSRGIDTRMITREMVRGFETSEGAQVLAPNWEKINPLLMEMFGQ